MAKTTTKKAASKPAAAKAEKVSTKPAAQGKPAGKKGGKGAR